MKNTIIGCLSIATVLAAVSFVVGHVEIKHVLAAVAGIVTWKIFFQGER